MSRYVKNEAFVPDDEERDATSPAKSVYSGFGSGVSTSSRRESLSSGAYDDFSFAGSFIDHGTPPSPIGRVDDDSVSFTGSFFDNGTPSPVGSFVDNGDASSVVFDAEGSGPGLLNNSFAQATAMARFSDFISDQSNLIEYLQAAHDLLKPEVITGGKLDGGLLYRISSSNLRISPEDYKSGSIFPKTDFKITDSQISQLSPVAIKLAQEGFVVKVGPSISRVYDVQGNSLYEMIQGLDLFENEEQIYDVARIVIDNLFKYIQKDSRIASKSPVDLELTDIENQALVKEYIKMEEELVAARSEVKALQDPALVEQSIQIEEGLMAARSEIKALQDQVGALFEYLDGLDPEVLDRDASPSSSDRGSPKSESPASSISSSPPIDQVRSTSALSLDLSDVTRVMSPHPLRRSVTPSLGEGVAVDDHHFATISPPASPLPSYPASPPTIVDTLDTQQRSITPATPEGAGTFDFATVSSPSSPERPRKAMPRPIPQIPQIATPGRPLVDTVNTRGQEVTL